MPILLDKYRFKKHSEHEEPFETGAGNNTPQAIGTGNNHPQVTGIGGGPGRATGIGGGNPQQPQGQIHPGQLGGLLGLGAGGGLGQAATQVATQPTPPTNPLAGMNPSQLAHFWQSMGGVGNAAAQASGSAIGGATGGLGQAATYAATQPGAQTLTPQQPQDRTWGQWAYDNWPMLAAGGIGAPLLGYGLYHGMKRKKRRNDDDDE